MTPNLASARQAIQAELLHARQGIEFYTARVEALETALTQLESVDSEEVASPDRGGRSSGAGVSRRGRKPGRQARAAAPEASTSQKGKRGRRARAGNSAGGGDALPTTGADFWLRLVTEDPQSAVDIANAAAAQLGLKPEQKDQIQKLKQRVAPALTSLVTSQKIQDTGAGRERRFFRAGAEAG